MNDTEKIKICKETLQSIVEHSTDQDARLASRNALRMIQGSEEVESSE